MPVELCRHIKTNGCRCQSPALTQQIWCFFHSRLNARHRELRASKEPVESFTIVLPPLENRESVQVAVSLLAEAIATRRIDDKHAASLINVLRLASRNIGRPGDLMIEPPASWVQRSFIPTLDGLPLTENHVPGPRGDGLRSTEPIPE